MLEVGCPDPALVLARTESTRSCAASSATVSRPVSDVEVIVVIGDSHARTRANRSGVNRGDHVAGPVHHMIAPGDHAVVTASGPFAYPLAGTSGLWLAADQDGGWR